MRSIHSGLETSAMVKAVVYLTNLPLVCFPCAPIPHQNPGGTDSRWHELPVWNKWIQVYLDELWWVLWWAPQLPRTERAQSCWDNCLLISPLNYFLGLSLSRESYLAQNYLYLTQEWKRSDFLASFKALWAAISAPEVPPHGPLLAATYLTSSSVQLCLFHSLIGDVPEIMPWNSSCLSGLFSYALDLRQ